MRCEWMTESTYSSMKGKNILVAGGTGFIGKRAVEIFSGLGLDVYVLSRNSHKSLVHVTYVQADLFDIDTLRKAFQGITFDYAVYMAANIPLRSAKKENYYDAKLSTFDPFLNFCEAFLSRVARFVYISSIDVLGGCPDFEYDENAPVRIPTPYGLAKYVGEFYTKSICRTLDIPYTILRYSQVYGPNEPVVRIIPIMKRAMEDGSIFTLVTDGNEKRRFLFVDDAVKALLNGLAYARSEIYNIAGPDIITMKGLVQLIEETWGRKIDLAIKGERKGEDNVPSYAKAREHLHYRPDVGMVEGMRIVMEEENVGF